MGSEVPLSIFALAFLVLSIPLLAGRGSWLVAGYNTMTSSQRAQYDGRKLCRATGCMLLGVSIAFSLMARCGAGSCSSIYMPMLICPMHGQAWFAGIGIF